MIGLSVSLCLRDIVDGKVAENDVKIIIAGTHARTKDEWNSILGRYANIYWRRQDFAAINALFTRLMEQGKIFQPREFNGDAPNISDGWWMGSDDMPESCCPECGEIWQEGKGVRVTIDWDLCPKHRDTGDDYWYYLVAPDVGE